MGKSSIVWMGVFGVCVLRCSADEPVVPMQASSGSIGPAGGTLELARGVRVTVPAGAIADGTELRASTSDAVVASPPAGFTIIGPVVAITPHGTTFSAPITIGMPASSPAGTVQTLSDDQDESWELVPGVERSAGTLTFTVTHVSYFAELAPGGEAGTPPSDAAPTGCGHIAPTTVPIFDLIGVTGQWDTPGVTTPAAVSADGSTVAGNQSNGSSSFRWRKSTGLEVVETLFPFINCDGSVYLGFGDLVPDSQFPGLRKVTLVSPQRVAVLQTLPSYPIAAVHAMNAAGTLLVGESQGGSWGPASIWSSDGTVKEIGHGLDGTGYPMSISADGKFISGVLKDSNGLYQAYRYSESTGITIIKEEATTVLMSADGQTIAAVSGDGTPSPRTFLWNASAGLSEPCGSVPCQAYVVSGDGRVLIGDTLVDGSYERFVWTSSRGMRRLDDVLAAAGVSYSKWKTLGVTAMTPDARVLVGNALDAQRNSSGYRLVLPDGAFD